jgi:hypothetical protein
MFDFSDTVVGALLGIIATLAGTLVTHWLTRDRDRLIRREELGDALKTVELELLSQGEKLDPEDVSQTLDCSAYEILKLKGLLADLPPKLAADIIGLYQLLQRINEEIKGRDNALFAIIAGGASVGVGQKWDITSVVEKIRNLKREAREKVNGCIEAIRNYQQGNVTLQGDSPVPKSITQASRRRRQKRLTSRQTV